MPCDHSTGGPARPRRIASGDERSAGKDPCEVCQRPGLGAREAVDALGIVADRGEVVALAHPASEQPQLRGRDVLELVDDEEAEFFVDAFTDPGL